MNVRIARSNDLEAVQRLVDSAFSPYTERIGRPPSSMTRAFLPLIESEEVYVCELAGRIVGTMTINTAPEYIEISSVAVEPSLQRRGVGKCLMGFAEDIALRLGVGVLTLYTNAALPDVAAYYQCLGYRVIERKHGDGYDRIYLEKQLSRASA